MSQAFTILEVLEQLYRKGYTEDFRVVGQNMLVVPTRILVDPKHIVIDDIYRFEGETDLEEEAVIFAW